MKVSKYLLIALTLILLFSETMFSAKRIVWQNPFARILDCQIIDSLNYVISGDDGLIISTQDGGITWKWLECGLRNILYNIDFMDINKGIVVGSDGAFALTTDAGKSWKTGTIDSTTFYAVKMLDENTIIAVAENTCVYKSFDLGKSWNKVYKGDSLTLKNWFFLNYKPSTITQYFYNSDICFIDENNGFICGVGPYVLKTTDGGNKWEKVLQQGDSTLFTDIDFYDELNGLVVGSQIYWNPAIKYWSYKPVILLTTDAGNSWDTLQLNKNKSIFSVKMYDSNRFYLTGNNSLSFVTYDKGKTWLKHIYVDHKYIKDNQKNKIYEDTIVSAGDTYSLQRFSYDDFGNILGINTTGVIVKSIDFGENYFTLKKHQSFKEINIKNLMSFTDSRLIVYGVCSWVFESTDAGNSWDNIYPRYEINTDEDRQFWAPIYSWYSSLTTGFFRDSLVGFIAGSKTNNGIINHTIFTTDAGATWQTNEVIDSRYSNSMYFISKDVGFAIAKDSMVWKTNDGGYTWDTVNIFPRSTEKTEKDWNNIPKQIFFPDSVNGYLTVFSGWVTTNDLTKFPSGKKSIMTILHTKDSCRTFDTLQNIDLTAANSFDIRFYTQTEAVAYGYKNIIFKTNNAFRTYEEILLPGTFHFITDVHFIDSNFAIASGVLDTIFISRDGGKSWKIEIIPLNRYSDDYDRTQINFLGGIHTSKNGDIYLIGANRVIRGYAIEDSTIAVDEQIDGGRYCPFYYIHINPNPVLGTAKIKIIGLHYAQGKRLYLRIYDINGNYIKDISEEANLNNDGNNAEFEAELHDLPNGIYFIELEANNLIRVQKFIKE
ncbi:T9SS C-terminal target domain-containing protein [Bacteroidetes/Chlorobi group bacterium ChocPot_Mid]|nr:MAG: T9SS C-terminal target domain-containing protein [Bacteroidetes/Chlorobi group bacterium ChocPot_Mid]